MHPISWIGRSVYCKLETDNHHSNAKNCPICDRKLRLIYFNGDKDPIPPDEYFDGEIEKDGWKYCHTVSIWKRITNFIKSKYHLFYPFFIALKYS